MNEFQQEIYKTIDILTEQKLKQLGFDKTKRGKVISVNNDIAIVQIDGEDYSCKLRRGIYVQSNDIVFVKFPQNNDLDKYVETVLGGNETPEYLIISADEILEKIKTVDGDGSGLDADTLDGKHASEFALVGDLGNIDISGETIVQNINSTTSIIDDKNLSLNVNDAISKKHEHGNISLIESVTQALIDGWNSAVTHISDVVRHITSSERTLWNTVSDKSDKFYVDTELNKKLDKTLKGVANGLAELDSDGKVPSFQLPSYVDDVLEYNSLTNFPTTGESGKIYVAIDTNKTYRWSGTNYIPISSDLALGETSSTAYRGDRGKIAYDHSQIPHDKTLVGLENVDNVKQATKTEFDNHNNDTTIHITSEERNTWYTVNNKVDKITGKQLSTEDYSTEEKNKLSNIEEGANNYTLPIASIDMLGGIKIGANLSITEDGTVSALSGDERSSFIIKQEIFVAEEGQKLFSLTKGSYQPNTNTISVYIYGGKQPNVVFSETSSTSIEFTEPLKTGNVVIIEYIELSTATPYPIHGNDHLTDGYDPIPKVTATSDGLMAKEDKSKLDGVESGANKYTHPSTHPTSMIVESTTQRFVSDTEKSTWNTVANKADLTYVDIGLSNKVDKVAGKGLSAEDYTTTEKNKLEGIEDEANKYIHPFSHSIDMITESTTNKIMTVEERNKLAGIQSSATKNDTDTNLRDRSTHTGTQSSSTISDFASSVRTTVLTGLSTATNAVITATDSVLTALGKLQKQISNNLNTLSNHIGNKTNPHETTKSQIGLGNVDNTSDLEKPISTATQLALDGKVDNSRVLTDVPANAKFTDTIYTHPTDDGNLHVPATGVTNNGKVLKAGATAGSLVWADDKDTITTINGKTGAIAKADIVALGIPAQDTVYTHPSSHPASMITEDETRRFISDTEKSVWNNKAEVSQIPTKVSELTNDSNYITQDDLGDAGFGDMVKGVYDTNNNGIVDNAEKVNGFTVDSNVPANAKFTDTVYTHPSTHPASMITESISRRFVSDTEKVTWNNKAEIDDIPTKFVHVDTSAPSNTNIGWIDTSL